MRTLVLLMTLAVFGTFAAVTPTASAVGTCSNLTDPHCPHTFCYGYSWSYPNYYYDCHRYVDLPGPYPCRICETAGVAVLP